MVRQLRWAASLLILLASIGGPAVGGLAGRVRASWRSRIAVVGDSMAPTLRSGDWLLVDPEAYRRRPPGVGELVVAPDPRGGPRLLIKRVAGTDAEGRLRLAGDDPAASTDSRAFGTVDVGTVKGRPWIRYWPPGRIGRVG